MFISLFNKINNIFTEHPHNVCMTYFSHMRFSLSLSYLLLQHSAKSVIHSLIPCYYTKSSSELLTILDDKLKNSGCRSNTNTELNKNLKEKVQ
jgi:hypothetical protein